jgi:hypothetical protein
MDDAALASSTRCTQARGASRGSVTRRRSNARVTATDAAPTARSASTFRPRPRSTRSRPLLSGLVGRFGHVPVVGGRHIHPSPSIPVPVGPVRPRSPSCHYGPVGPVVPVRSAPLRAFQRANKIRPPAPFGGGEVASRALEERGLVLRGFVRPATSRAVASTRSGPSQAMGRRRARDRRPRRRTAGRSDQVEPCR